MSRSQVDLGQRLGEHLPGCGTLVGSIASLSSRPWHDVPRHVGHRTIVALRDQAVSRRPVVVMSGLDDVRCLTIVAPSEKGPWVTEPSDKGLVMAVLNGLSERGVDIRGKGAVGAYLSKHNDLISAVRQMGARLKAAVPKGGTVALEVYRDPEIDEEYLVYYLRTNAYTDAFVDTVHDLGVETSSLFRGRSEWIVVTTDFGKPG